MKITTVVRVAVRILLTAVFAVGGVMHFTNPGQIIGTVPPLFPFPLALIYFTGTCFVAGAVGIWPPATRWLAGWALITLLVAVFPANIYDALNPNVSAISNPPTASIGEWIRLPFQFVFIGLVYWTCIAGEKRPDVFLPRGQQILQ